MEPWLPYSLLADLLLVVHAAFAAFIVIGLLLVYYGKLRGWRWVTNPWLRVSHLAGVAVVALQSWLGVICPLTTWEMSLRAAAGERAYADTFVSYWLGRILYLDLPAWVFVAGYTGFAILALFAWRRVPPRPFRKSG